MVICSTDNCLWIVKMRVNISRKHILVLLKSCSLRDENSTLTKRRGTFSQDCTTLDYQRYLLIFSGKIILFKKGAIYGKNK
ncbi:hypothetical protein A6279_23595 [Bacillus wiedmannii]|nr:hypothetical protein A6278_27385 [Bacillus wiedmannii]OAK12441.1 hypothetical protein A6279_23595 [Bacillus wiedmannii]